MIHKFFHLNPLHFIPHKIQQFSVKNITHYTDGLDQTQTLKIMLAKEKLGQTDQM